MCALLNRFVKNKFKKTLRPTQNILSYLPLSCRVLSCDVFLNLFFSVSDISIRITYLRNGYVKQSIFSNNLISTIYFKIRVLQLRWYIFLSSKSWIGPEKHVFARLGLENISQKLKGAVYLPFPV